MRGITTSNGICHNSTSLYPRQTEDTQSISGQGTTYMVWIRPFAFVCVAASEWSDRLWLGQCDARAFSELTPGIQVGSRVCRLVNLSQEDHLTSPHHSFVFSNYSWDDTNLDYTTYNGTTIPNHIPMTAMIIGIPSTTVQNHRLMLLHQGQSLVGCGHQGQTCRAQ
jgi:hypothetical protein